MDAVTAKRYYVFRNMLPWGYQNIDHVYRTPAKSAQLPTFIETYL